MKAFLSSGGGVRIGASFGAHKAGNDAGAIAPWDHYDCIMGTSAGALHAALFANGWTGQQMCDLFINTDFGKLFTPWLVPYSVRLKTAAAIPISLHRLAAFIDSLKLEWKPNLMFNTLDTQTNEHVIYCWAVPDWVETYTTWKGIYSHGGAHRWQPLVGIENPPSLGTLITQSMALPLLKADDKERYRDGGVIENPGLSVICNDDDVTMFHLGYAGDVEYKHGGTPKNLVALALYLFERNSAHDVALQLPRFTNLRHIKPRVYDVDSVAFDSTASQKQRMTQRGYTNTVGQWDQT